MQRTILTSLVAAIALVAVCSSAEAAFPGANGRIAFATNRDGNFEIYSMNPDGSGLTRLTSNGTTDAQPAWSPEGTKVAFTSFGPGYPQIWVMNADGTGSTRLTDNFPGGDSAPAWSPGGTQIVFSSGRDSSLRTTSSRRSTS